MYWQNTDS